MNPVGLGRHKNTDVGRFTVRADLAAVILTVIMTAVSRHGPESMARIADLDCFPLHKLLREVEKGCARPKSPGQCIA